jgi:transposase
MAGEYWLSDEAWAVIDPLLPKVYPGARRKEDRRIISGIIHVLRSGCRWQDCPAVYGPSTTVYNRFNRWSGRGRWLAIFDALVRTVPDDVRSIDSSSIKVQRAAAGGKGGHWRRLSAARAAAGRPRSTRSPTAKGGCSASF